MTTTTGGCYCGATRYALEGEPLRRTACYCRECQYLSGGGANYVMAYTPENFTWTKGTPTDVARSDLDAPRKRQFCPTCGTHITTVRPDGSMVMVKAGTLDDPAFYGQPENIIQTADAQPFHLFPEGVPASERFPG